MKITGTHTAVYLGLFTNLYNGKISHVTVSGEIDATVSKTEYNSFTEIGGIVGLIINKGTLTNCTNSGRISLTKGAMTTELYTGAIIGQIDEDDTVILNGYTNTGSPSSIIGFYEFSGSTGSLTISETVDGATTIINSGSGAYPIPDEGISLGDRENATW